MDCHRWGLKRKSEGYEDEEARVQRSFIPFSPYLVFTFYLSRSSRIATCLVFLA